MRLILNVTNKTLTFEKGVKYTDIRKAIDTIVENDSALCEYEILLGSVPTNNIVKIKTPATYSYDRVLDYEWIERTPSDNVKVEDSSTEPNPLSLRAGFLKDGIYNIEIE